MTAGIPKHVVLSMMLMLAAAFAAPLRAQTFNKDILPIFQKKCQSCHHEGTVAPMPLMTYKDARPWARAIKERVLKREMPPWHLDKTVGIRRYKNDISLSDAEISTIVKWVDAGAPEGDATDMPKQLAFASEDEWFTGKPDLLVTTNDFGMYPAGPDWWIDQYAEMTLTDNRWIKSMEIKPSNRRIVHHAVVYGIEPNPPAGTPETGIQLNEYEDGKYGNV